MRVWMTMDPETRRVALQDREFGDGDFPPGLRGLGWPQREGELHDDAYAAIMEGGLTAEQINDIHRTCWSQNGDTPWPSP